MIALQILIDGFAISALYGLGAVGFTLMFGVSGVLNLAHGGTMLVAAVVAWLVADRAGAYGGALAGLLAGMATAFATYFLVVRPIQRSRAIPREETEIFVLTGTLLWGIMLQEAVAYFTTTSPHTVRPLIGGVIDILGVRTPANELLTAVLCWSAIGGLWLLINRTRVGKALLAASINPRGLTLLGFEMQRIHLLVWAIYGVLAGTAGVLLGSFLGVSSDNAGTLTASAFSIVVLGGLGSVSGSLIAAYAVGYLETITAYTISPSLRSIPALLLLVVYVRPQGLLGRR
jgi:branched-chain amino acid transport system permease protein